jgi:hypothetical protein
LATEEEEHTMKNLKSLGLAMLAATAVMATSANTASATTLFTDSAKTIAFPAGETFHATLKPGTSAKLTNTSHETLATCGGSTVHGTTSSKSGAAIAIAIGTLTWEGCSQTTHTVAKGSLDVAFTSGTSGSVTGTANQVTVSIFGVTCTYGTGEGTKLGSLTGGSEPIIAINAVVLKTAGPFLCPSSGYWDAEYIVTSPHALFVGA